MTLDVHSILSHPFEENTYVVRLPGRSDALVIDPGLEPDLILEYLRKQNLSVAAILATHGHADHIGGNAYLKEIFPDAPLLIGAGDAPMLTSAMLNLSAVFGEPIVSPPADRVLKEGDRIDYAGICLEVLEVPGHSPGHIVFVWRGEPCRVFGGDVLFQGSIGRCDFPGGDLDLLLSGIRGKLFTLPADTIIYPGHGPTTTTGREQAENPFLAD